MSAYPAVCIMWPVLGKQVHVANLYRHILYHFWLDDSMYCTYRDIYYISPSGCVHYVACIGKQVHSAKLISIHVISLQIIWLHVLYISGHILISAHLAVCIMWPVLGTGTFCKTYVDTITFVNIWLHVMYISQHIYLYHSVCLCALCNLYWGQVHAANLYRNMYYITYDYMIACNVHIGTYIISAHLAVCIM